jgi:hypothetical protein
MMRKFWVAAVAAAALGSASLAAGAGPAQAQDARLATALERAQQAEAPTDYSQYNRYGPRRSYSGRSYGGRGYYGRSYGGPRYYGRSYAQPYYYRRNRGNAAAAGALGLAAGAIIGGAIASQQAQAAQSSHAYCSQRFRSYDPRSGTYLGYDGLRHPCP